MISYRCLNNLGFLLMDLIGQFCYAMHGPKLHTKDRANYLFFLKKQKKQFPPKIIIIKFDLSSYLEMAFCQVVATSVVTTLPVPDAKTMDTLARLCPARARALSKLVCLPAMDRAALSSGEIRLTEGES